MVDLTVELLAEVYEYAIPIAFVLEFSNILVSTVLRTAFGGRLWFGY